MKKIWLIIATLMIFIFTPPAYSQVEEAAIEACIAVRSRTADKDITLAELRLQCQKITHSAIGRRVAFEKAALSNPFSVLPHKPNYVLPITYFNANEQPYVNRPQRYKLDDLEAKFQFSVKYIAAEDFLTKGLDLEIAFTTTSWWQSYNSKISSPFRETNYEPELILSYKKNWSFIGAKVAYSSFSFSHQSNGQTGELSRSWNRIAGKVAFVHNDFIWNLRAWWRLPEKDKNNLGDPDGDDNPNIERYMGYAELGAIWRLPDRHNVDLLLRNNLRSNNKGSIKLGWSFPFSKHLRWYVEYFSGYGESLIYFDQNTSRIGFGVKLTDWL